MKLHSLEHSSLEGPAKIAAWAEKRGHSLHRNLLHDGATLPNPDDFEGLVVMGGPMAVGDEATHPWLSAEKKLIKEAIAQGKKILGICLGAQLVADAMGAKVYPANFKEIGWFTLDLTEEAKASPLFKGIESPFLAFQWHGDTFELPTGATPVARGKIILQQGFMVGQQILALQFHPEITFEDVAAWMKHSPEEMAEGAKNPYIQRPYQLLASPERFTATEALLNTLLDRFFDPGKKPLKVAKKKA